MQSVARRSFIKGRCQNAVRVASQDEHDRPVELGDLVEEDPDIDHLRPRHVVLHLPGGVVLVPSPGLAVISGLGIDRILVQARKGPL